jgi:hypothetical protein
MGLSAMISGEAFEVTAETIGPCLVNFVEQEDMLRRMEGSGELGLRSPKRLAASSSSPTAKSELVLSRSSSGKLLRLLLSWVGHDTEKGPEVRIHAP